MKNKIKYVLDKKGISIKKLSKGINSPYAFTYTLVNRADLYTTQLGTMAKVAKFLGVRIEELYDIDN